jgi:hypothetical protein
VAENRYFPAKFQRVENRPACSILVRVAPEHPRGRQRNKHFDGNGNGPMTISPGLLAGAFRVAEENSIRALIPAGSTVAQVAVYAGALLVVGAAVFVWAVFFRRQRRRRRHSHHHHRSKSVSRHQQQPEAPSRPRTLAEAGGLPPLRNQPPPPL